MSKKKILVCNELHTLNTGYSNYGKELLMGLSQIENFDVAEQATYLKENDATPINVPWKMLPAEPPVNSKARQAFDADPANVFGKFMLERNLNDFRPNYVIDFRDYWMMDFENNTPFRKHFNWLIMPACDAYPQNEQWLYTYSQADGCFSYSDWGANILKTSSNNKINMLGSASPCAPKEYVPLDINKCKNMLGIDSDMFIIGTVMRNQRRKLYPELFQAFSKYIDENNRSDIFMYCHTSYPDHGWDFPYLLKFYGITNRVLFTYQCRNPSCRTIEANFFSDVARVCPKCNELAMCLPNVKDGLSHQEMAVVYNAMDLYVQYANSEGFGMPAVEAASCGVPLAVVNYSAMCDFVNKLYAMPVEPIALYTEVETGCKRAVPDDRQLIEHFKKFFNLPRAMQLIKRQTTRDAFCKHYNYKTTVQKWIDAINSIDNSVSWNAPPRINQPNFNIPNNLNNVDFARFIIKEVLGEPERIGTYFESRLVRDITYGYIVGGNPGSYFNEDSDKFSKTSYQQFSREDAVKYMAHLANKRNHWESVRTGQR